MSFKCLDASRDKKTVALMLVIVIAALLVTTGCTERQSGASLDKYCDEVVGKLSAIQKDLDSPTTSNQIALDSINQWLMEWDNGFQQMRVLTALEKKPTDINAARE
jgi:hypothetical protein